MKRSLLKGILPGCIWLLGAVLFAAHERPVAPPDIEPFHLVRNINAQPASPQWGNRISRAGERAYFMTWPGEDRMALWVTDGTPEGSRLVRDFMQSRSEAEPSIGSLAPMGPLVFFFASDKDRGTALWRSDGTPEGTAMAADIQAGPASSAPEQIIPSGSSIFFTADDGRTGRGLWRYDPPGP